MIQRSQEDRRAHVKGRKNLGRRKHERYSVIAYNLMISSLLMVLLLMIAFILYSA